MQQYFRVSPPSVHQMVLTLEREGFIKGNQEHPAASNCSSIPSSSQSYFDPRSNLSKSLRRGTSRNLGESAPRSPPEEKKHPGAVGIRKRDLSRKGTALTRGHGRRRRGPR